MVWVVSFSFQGNETGSGETRKCVARNGFVSEVFVVALRLGHLKVAATCALSEESETAGRHPCSTAWHVIAKPEFRSSCTGGASSTPTKSKSQRPYGSICLVLAKSALLTSVNFLSLRMRLGALVPSRWRLPECMRKILPVAVILKRFFAPRWVLSVNLGLDRKSVV